MSREGKVALRLAVQYGTEAPELPRWRLRRWALKALSIAVEEEAALMDTPRFHQAHLTIRLVDAVEGQALNQSYRQRDYATNVLTFEYGVDPEGTLASDIVLCMPVLQREATEQGKSVLDHAAHLTVHGVLHALGYDHLDEEEAEDMEALETRILASLGITNPYL